MLLISMSKDLRTISGILAMDKAPGGLQLTMPHDEVLKHVITFDPESRKKSILRMAPFCDIAEQKYYLVSVGKEVIQTI